MDIWKILEYFEKNISVVVSAPIAMFVIIIVAFLGARWLYQERIESLKSQIKSMEENHKVEIDTLNRIKEEKEHIITEYRQRLQIETPDKSAYTRMTNEELRRKAMDLVNRAREFWTEQKGEQRRMLEKQSRRDLTARSSSVEKAQKRFLQDSAEMSLQYFQGIAYYESKYKVDVILLRDAIRPRLPEDLRIGRVSDFKFEHANNQLVIEDVIDELERLAKSLP